MSGSKHKLEINMETTTSSSPIKKPKLNDSAVATVATVATCSDKTASAVSNKDAKKPELPELSLTCTWVDGRFAPQKLNWNFNSSFLQFKNHIASQYKLDTSNLEAKVQTQNSAPSSGSGGETGGSSDDGKCICIKTHYIPPWALSSQVPAAAAAENKCMLCREHFVAPTAAGVIVSEPSMSATTNSTTPAPVEAKANFVKGKCSHVFHADCIKHMHSLTCPTCVAPWEFTSFTTGETPQGIWVFTGGNSVPTWHETGLIASSDAKQTSPKCFKVQDLAKLDCKSSSSKSNLRRAFYLSDRRLFNSTDLLPNQSRVYLCATKFHNQKTKIKCIVDQSQVASQGRGVKYEMEMTLDTTFGHLKTKIAQLSNNQIERVQMVLLTGLSLVDAGCEIDESKTLDDVIFEYPTSRNDAGELYFNFKIDTTNIQVLNVFAGTTYLPTTISNESFYEIAKHCDGQLYLGVSLVPKSVATNIQKVEQIRFASGDSDGRVSSVENMVASSIYWQPFVMQTDAGISCWLSCLYVLASKLAVYKDPEDWDTAAATSGTGEFLLNTLMKLEFVTPTKAFGGGAATVVAFTANGNPSNGSANAGENGDTKSTGVGTGNSETHKYTTWSPPALEAFRNVFAKRVSQLYAADKQILSNAWFATIRSMVPDRVPDNKVFEYSHIALSYLARECPSKTAMWSMKSHVLSTSAEASAIEKPIETAYKTCVSANVQRIWMYKRLDTNEIPKTTAAVVAVDSKATTTAVTVTNNSVSVARGFQKNNWNSLVKNYSLLKALAILSPASLASTSPPVMTRNSKGITVVFVGRSKNANASTTVYAPLLGETEDFDGQSVGAVLDDALNLSAVELESMVQRKSNEALYILMDKSTSMQEEMQFSKASRPRSNNDSDGDSDDDAPQVVSTYSSRSDTFALQWGLPYDKKNPREAENSKLLERNNRLIEQFLRVTSKRMKRVYRAIVDDHSVRQSIFEYIASPDFEGSRDDIRLIASAIYNEKWQDLFKSFDKQPPLNVGDDAKNHRRYNAVKVDETCPNEFYCPITYEIMKDPVSTSDGFTYDRIAIEEWLKVSQTSPMTNEVLSYTRLTPNYSLRSQIATFHEKKKQLALEAANAKATAKAEAKAKAEAEKTKAKAEAEKAKVDNKCSGELDTPATMITVMCKTLSGLAFSVKINPKTETQRSACRKVAKKMKCKSIGGVRVIWGGKIIDNKSSDPLPEGSFANNSFWFVVTCHGVVAPSSISDDTDADASDDTWANDDDADGEAEVEDETDAYARKTSIERKYCISVQSMVGWSSRTHTLKIDSNDSTQSVKLDIYTALNILPSSFELWTKYNKETMDGYRYGTLVESRYMSSYLGPDEEDSEFTLPESLKNGMTYFKRPIKFFAQRFVDREKKDHEERANLNRLDTCKQLFGAFLNRAISYDMPKHVGLILFGSDIEHTCKLTPFYESFRKKIDRASACGDTKLYDALKFASDQLLEWRKEYIAKQNAGVAGAAGGAIASASTASNSENASAGSVAGAESNATNSGTESITNESDIPLRILVLTDGQDQGSKLSAMEIVSELQRNKIIVDSIHVGPEANSRLRGISHATKGLSYVPKNISDIYNICEADIMLCSHQRTEPLRSVPVLQTYSSWEFARLCERDEDTDFTSRQKKPAELEHDVMDLKKAYVKLNKFVANHGKEDSLEPTQMMTRLKRRLAEQQKNKRSQQAKEDDGQPTLQMMKRLLKEMKLCNDKPHPSFDIYPSDEDLRFWKIVMEGPDSTPYKDGTFALYIHFTKTYPETAPVVKFITPIRHCNINSSGRVCFSLLDRNWVPETTVSVILQGIYSLMLNPSAEDPLNSVLAQQFYGADGQYEASIMQHVKEFAKKSRAAYRKELLMLD